MRKMLLFNALWALLFAAVFVGVAGAQVQGPNEYGGHGWGQCEPATHASYYDVRNSGQTVYNQDRPNGDNAYYVDTDPLAGFKPDGNYEGSDSSTHDCDGTPVVQGTAYVAVTVQGELFLEDKHVGYPKCPREPGDTRNPSCTEPKTGVYGGFYVATGDGSHEAGKKAGVANPFSEG